MNIRYLGIGLAALGAILGIVAIWVWAIFGVDPRIGVASGVTVAFLLIAGWILVGVSL